MTDLSRRNLRTFLSEERPDLVADIGGRDSRTSYADITPAHVYDLPTFDVCLNNLPTLYGIIVCTDVFEHIHNPVEASLRLAAGLQPNGKLFLSTVSSWPEHKFPVDTFRYMEDGLRWLFSTNAGLIIEKLWSEPDESGIRITLVARKPNVGERNP